MKALLYILITILTVRLADGQITYPSADYAIAGDTFRISHAKPDSLNSYNFQLTGAGYVWDFSLLQAESQYIDQYITPNSSGYRISFIAACVAAGGTTPSCNSQWNNIVNLGHLSPDSIVFGPFKFSNQVDLYEKTTASLSENVKGMSLGLNNITYPLTGKYTRPDTVYRFPLAYNNQDSCNSAYAIDLSGLGLNFKYYVYTTRINKVQGWGSLTTPYAYFASTLQMTTTLISTDTMVYDSSVIPIPIDTSIVYSWFSAQQARPVLQVTASLINGHIKYTDVEYIDTVRCLKPLATFNFTPINPYLGPSTPNVSVTFNNTSNNANEFFWNFDDTASGTANTSALTNPGHSFDSAGTYLVTLVACNSYCSPAQCDTIFLPVLVFDSSNVQADFSFTPLQPCTGDTLRFVNTSLNASTYNWSFGDLTTSTLKNPQKNYTTPGTYTITLIATGSGISDTVQQSVVVGSTPVATITPSGAITLCSGQSITLLASGGQTYRWSNGSVKDSIVVSNPGTYSVTAYNNCGNAVSQPVTVTSQSTVQPSVTITVSPNYSVCSGVPVTFTATVNNGGSSPQYQWIKNGITEGASNTWFYAAPANNDSVWCLLTSSAVCASPTTAISNKIKLTIKQPVAYSYTYAICVGTVYNFNGTAITQAGIYRDTLTAANGCDSVITLTLTVKPDAAHTVSAETCAGISYNFNGRALTQPGTYYDTLSSSNGCDSIVTLDLTVKPNATHAISAEICAGTNYNFNGTMLTQAGIYHDTLSSFNGCDSVITLTLSVVNTLRDTISQAICAGQLFEGYGQTGIYTDTFNAVGGCDSIRTLQLTVHAIFNDTITYSICQGSAYNGHSTSGYYADTLQATTGCDSISTLYLLINPVAAVPFISQHTDTLICTTAFNYQWYRDSLLLSGDTGNTLIISQNGNYSVTTGDSSGCFSISNVISVTNVGISDIAESETIAIFPNPAQNQLNFKINIGKTQDILIEILDVTGNRLLSLPFSVTPETNSGSMDISNLAQGYYNVSVVIQGAKLTYPFIKL